MLVLQQHVHTDRLAHLYLPESRYVHSGNTDHSTKGHRLQVGFLTVP
jgi:hypothetical protein